MNKRENVRKQVEVLIRLYEKGRIIAIAKTKNISKNGLFIRTNALLFPKGTVFDVEFTDSVNAPQKHVVAKVVHRCLDGVGVAFLMQNDSAATRMRSSPSVA